MKGHRGFALIIILILTGCSGTGIESPNIPTSGSDNPAAPGYVVSGDPSPETGSDRTILAIGTIDINPDTLTSTFLPNRALAKHWDVTPMLMPPHCSDCVKIQVLEFKPAEKFVKLEVTLKNPSNLTAYDVRGIVMTDDPDVHLLNADSYTSLWDDGGKVEINPFKAFATEVPQRAIQPHSSHSCEYEFAYSELQGLLTAMLLVDASWPANCREPYEIANAQTTGIFLDYDAQDITCEVLSWNGDVTSVTIDLTGLGWDDEMPMTHQGGDLWAIEGISWHCGGFGPGTHRAMISAKCEGSDLELYDYVDVTIEATPPAIGWGKSWGEPWNNQSDWYHDLVYSVCIDGSGNIFAVGEFRGTIDFDPGPGVDEHSGVPYSVFLVKNDSSGEFQWARTWGRPDGYGAYDPDIAMAMDSAGNIYTTGTGFGDLDPGPDVDYYDGTLFLNKLDPNGDYLWGCIWYNSYTSQTESYGIVLDADECVYIIGGFDSNMDFDPGPGVDTHNSVGKVDAFLCKLDSNGTYQWALTWGGEGDYTKAYVLGVAIDLDGNIYVTGNFQNTVDFDPGPATEIHTSMGGTDAFLSKFSPEGEFQWVRTWGTDGIYFDFALFFPDSGTDIAVDSFNHIYVSGYFFNPGPVQIDLDPGDGVDYHTSKGSYDIFLSKFDSDGIYLKGLSWGGKSYEHANALAIDGSDNICITGFFRDSVDFDPGPGIDMHKSTGGSNIFLSKLDQELNYLWAKTWGEEYKIAPHMDIGYDIVTDDSNSVYLGGAFFCDWPQSYLDFNPGPGIEYHTSWGFDALLIKVDENGNW